MSQAALSELIKSPDLEKLQLMLAKPNFFEILHVANLEIRHSNFLAWILNPKETHNLGDVFARWFFKEIFSDAKVAELDEFQVDGLDTSSIRIHREYRNIDLLIELKDIVVVIENKIWSREHSQQLKRYAEIVETDFQKSQSAFVFLTPYNEAPIDEGDQETYVTFDYASIVKLLEQIVELYGDSMSPKVKLYLDDYIAVVRRYILAEDPAIEKAQQIYKNHQAALDFIFEHKPDRMLEAAEPISKAVAEAGYHLGSASKGYCRFLPKALVGLIPPSQEPVWKNGESFLFELAFRNKRMNLACVVSPGDQALRERIIKTLKKVKGAKNPSGTKWSTVHSHSHKIDIMDGKYDSHDALEQAVKALLEKEKSFIEDIESVLLEEFK